VVECRLRKSGATPLDLMAMPIAASHRTRKPSRCDLISSEPAWRRQTPTSRISVSVSVTMASANEKLHPIAQAVGCSFQSLLASSDYGNNCRLTSSM
jgi:hypothetical protein